MLSVASGPGTSTELDRRFERLFRAYQPRLLGVAERVLGDPHEAEDVLQEAFLRLARAGDDDASDARGGPILERDDQVVSAWLRRVVLNLALNRLRERRRAANRLGRAERLESTLDPDRAQTDHGSPTQQALRAEVRAEVQAALTDLPERQRACLLLRHAGYSYSEIAASVGIAAGSVGVYLARAERAFRLKYQATHHDDRSTSSPDVNTGAPS